MKPRLVPVLCASLVVFVACEKQMGPTAAPPEPIDALRTFDSYGELLTTIHTAMRTGDTATARSIIATEGQVTTMCQGYMPSTGGPFDPPSIEVAAAHCQEVYAPIPEEAIIQSLAEDDHGVQAKPFPDPTFDTWHERCPDLQVFMLTGVFEVEGDDLPQTGFEVGGIYTYQGKWGLMNIPRCRAEGE